MPTLPFFPALTCPRCDAAHDFYVPPTDGPPFGPDALYVYRCPTTKLPSLLAPVIAPAPADRLTFDSVPLFRVG